jgi:MATE family multidrug resistance protein
VLPKALQEIFDWVALKDTFVLKSNILIRFVALISAYSIFTNLSAVLGTDVLAQNGLLLQIAFLSQFAVQGVGLTTQTLIGNFKSKGNQKQMMPLLTVSMVAALALAFVFAFISIVFPDQVFGLLTNHPEVNNHISEYTIWLLPVLVITAIAFILEGYFIGLKAGASLRNAVLLAFFVGFSPLAIAAWYFHNNHLLWATLVSYMTTIMVVLTIQIPGTLNIQNLEKNKPLTNS